MRTSSGVIVKMPGIYRRVKENKEYIVHLLDVEENKILIENWGTEVDSRNTRLLEWCKRASQLSNTDYDLSLDVLETLFYK